MDIRIAAVAAAVGFTMITTTSLSAQVDSEPQAATRSPARWELLVPSGTMLPTGAQRAAIKRGNVSAIQLTYAIRPALAITSMVGWARSRDLETAGSPKLDVFTYDVGVEARAPHSTEGAISFRPFAGVGAGGRSYNYRKLDVDATHNVAAYGSVGGELGVHRVRVRIEARDYVSGFKPLAGEGTARTANDVVLMVGLHLVSR